MEPEQDIYTWVGASMCNLYQALFWPSPPPNFESLGTRLAYDELEADLKSVTSLLPACHKPFYAGDRLVIGLPQAYFL